MRTIDPRILRSSFEISRRSPRRSLKDGSAAPIRGFAHWGAFLVLRDAQRQLLPRLAALLGGHRVVTGPLSDEERDEHHTMRVQRLTTGVMATREGPEMGYRRSGGSW
jgi:hypothetical protein